MLRNIFLFSLFSLSSLSMAVDPQPIFVKPVQKESKARLITKASLQGLGSIYCGIVFLHLASLVLFKRHFVHAGVNKWTKNLLTKFNITEADHGLNNQELDKHIKLSVNIAAIPALALPAFLCYFFAKRAYQNGKKLYQLSHQQKQTSQELHGA